MTIGHWACAYLTHRTAFRGESLALLVVAGYFPDLLDKALNIFLGLSGRNVGHSLSGFACLILLTWLLFPIIGLERRSVWPVGCMWAAHVITDQVDWVVLFWPFMGPLGSAGRYHFLAAAYQTYAHPTSLVFVMLEGGLVAAALGLWVSARIGRVREQELAVLRISGLEPHEDHESRC
jgi:hypothetical protein